MAGMRNLEHRDTCPAAAPPHVTVYTRVLHRACEKAGGVEHLAHRLGISASLLERWLEGRELPPSSIFLQCVDLVLP
jgi:hypothetical protein